MVSLLASFVRYCEGSAHHLQVGAEICAASAVWGCLARIHDFRCADASRPDFQARRALEGKTNDDQTDKRSGEENKKESEQAAAPVSQRESRHKAEKKEEDNAENEINSRDEIIIYKDFGFF